jgi:ABC-type branched-subunit amino acid transport system permease subunit
VGSVRDGTSAVRRLGARRRVAVLAAVLLTLLPEVLRPIAEYRMILYSFMLIVLMILRPQGLFNFKFGKTRF